MVLICNPVVCNRARDEVKQILERALRRYFPADTVDISDGHGEQIHVLVVSRSFDAIRCTHQDALLWQIIDATELTTDEKAKITRVSAVSPALLK